MEQSTFMLNNEERQVKYTKVMFKHIIRKLFDTPFFKNKLKPSVHKRQHRN